MEQRAYWSVDECCWVQLPVSDESAVPVAVPVVLPQQREDEPAQEPVEA